MNYTTDWSPTKIENPNFKCRICKSDALDYRRWESADGGHEDLHYRCNECGREWWAEGADA